MSYLWRFNPFEHLYEHPKQPWARFYRTTFKGKCMDAFIAFMGKQNEDFEIETIGISDYLSLSLFLWIHQLFLWAFNEYKNNFQAFILLIPCLSLNITAWLTKIVVSVALTFFSLPFIAIAHQLSLYTGGAELKRQALEISGSDFSSHNRALSSLSLQQFLENHQRSFSELNMTLKISEPQLSSQVLDKVYSVSDRLAHMLYLKTPQNVNSSLKAQAKLTFLYEHPDQEPWLSNFNFLFSSVFLISMFPWLATISAKSLASQVSDRTTKAIWGNNKDYFEVIIDQEDKQQQQQLSALFKLNVSTVLNDLYPLAPVEDTDKLSIDERQRLTMLL